MKIWIDILTPKQVLFLGEIAKRLYVKGCNLLITIRGFRETVKLAEYKLSQFSPIVVGKYGGGTLYNKLKNSLERAIKLVGIVKDYNPDIVISYCSPEAARIAFGLGVPHYTISDIPQARAVSRLTIPLSDRLYCPWLIPKKEWVIYGIDAKRIFKYKGLDPIAWLDNYKFNREIIEELGIGSSPYIVIRTVEEYASYQLSIIKEWKSAIEIWLRNFLLKYRDYKAVILARYESQIKKYKKQFCDFKRVIIPEEPVDGPSLLKYAELFIGYGGTMSVEAALLGVPTISLRPGESPRYIQYLVKKGLIKQPKNEDILINVINKLLHQKNKYVQLAHKIRNKMINPAYYISNSVLNGLE